MAVAEGAGDYTVALDPGHGGSMHGAPGPKGLLEKDLTLDIARRIERRLRERGKVKVVLCREGDLLVPVRARVRCANQSAARLFLSLHANATPGAGTGKGRHRGFELYLAPVADVDADVKAATALAR